MKLSDKDVIKWLSVAKEAAVLAGAFLLERKGSNMKINKEVGRDIKIAADTESERIIIDYLKKNSDFSILSEESGFIKGDEEGFTWIVDPLDGSFNYMRGIPLCCVSIGLWQNKEPVLGAVYEFNHSELFSGIVGKGAWLNALPLKVSSISKKEKAVLCTGFPVNMEFSLENMQTFINNALSHKKTRLLGSAALSIAYVASGRTDIYQERDIMLWDIGGAIPILLAAGGKLDMKKSEKEYSYYISASNKCLV